MRSLKLRRWSNIAAAMIVSPMVFFLSGALTEWNGQRSEIEFPAEEFDQYVTYPNGFWLYGVGLFILVVLAGAFLSLVVRNAVITVDGYDKPKGSLQLRIWGFTITGFGVAFSSLNPFLGPLVFIAGLACLVVSIQQKCPDHSHLLES